MYDQFRWTAASARRNRLTLEYEPLQPFFLAALAEKAGCGTFLDVGANIGVYSLFATRVPTIERVIAFEADPATSNELQSNVALNSLEHLVEVQSKAVSSVPGELSFGVVGPLSGASGVVGTSIHDREAFREELIVEAVTLDQLIGKTARPLCIKIDVEGHESEVIRGASETLQANNAVIQLEDYEADGVIRRDLEELGYWRLTGIGPDHYYSNCEPMRDPAEVLEVYERALEQLIAFNHRSRPATFERGGLTLQLTGNSATIARRLRRLIGK